MLYRAGMVPEQKNDTEERAIARATAAIILGRRVGLKAEQSVASIYVINGRATLFGDAPLAVCRQHKMWDESGYAEWFEVDGKRIVGNPMPEDFKKPTTRCVISSLRKGASSPMLTTFSVADAVNAGLFGKNGSLYGAYGFRMIKFRARGYNLRDNFGDGMMGLGIKELADDDMIDADTQPIPTGTVDLRKPKPTVEPEPTPTIPRDGATEAKPVEPSQAKHRGSQLDDLFSQLESRGLKPAFYQANPDINGEDIVNASKAKQAAFMGKITAFLRENPE